MYVFSFDIAKAKLSKQLFYLSQKTVSKLMVNSEVISYEICYISNKTFCLENLGVPDEIFIRFF